MPNLPGSVALAAYGAALTGVNYIKCSMYGLKTREEAIYLLGNVVKAAKDVNPSIKIAAAGFADAERVGSIIPSLIPQIAREAKAGLTMLDTAIKDGKNILEFLNPLQIKSFIDESHHLGLTVALAGSIKKENLQQLCALGPDIIGVRGAACTQGDRVNGHIENEKVAELKQIIRNAQKPA
jgi:uncharacterized protein (UPF0264 family)